MEDGLKHCLKVSKTGESGDGAQAVQVLEERRGKAEQKKKKEEDALARTDPETSDGGRAVRAQGSRTAAGTVQCAARWSAEGRGRSRTGRERDLPKQGANLIQRLLLLAGVLALLGALLLRNLILRVFLGIFGGAFLLLFFPVRRFLLGESADGEAEGYDLSLQGRATERRVSEKKRILIKSFRKGSGAALPSAYEDGDGSRRKLPP